MSCKAVSVFVLILVALASNSARATQILINGTTTFFSNYEDDTSVAAGAIPTATYSTSVLPNDPQFGYWHSFGGTLAGGPPTFVQNVQVTNNAAGGTSGTSTFSPDAYSGDNYLRAFRAPTVFTSNPGTFIVQGPVETPTATVTGNTYHFETMISAQLTLNAGTAAVVGVFGIRDSDLSNLSDPRTGNAVMDLFFSTTGNIVSLAFGTTRPDTGLTWATDGSWQKLMIDYKDGEDFFTLTYGNQTPVEVDRVRTSSGGPFLGNGHVLATTFGKGLAGTTTGNGQLNGGVGSRLFYDSVGLVPVPEPGSFAMIGFGLLALAAIRRHKSAC